ncbi:MAG TPA: SDR family oxidoreductase [Terriglobales bacterium]|nr:SDR family oxidoreductase [Terriglobales bacterium]
MLDKRNVLITGASRGIGAATARLLAKHGAAVAVNYVNNSGAAERVVNEILSTGGRAMAVKADVRVHEDVEAMVKTVEEQLGPIDTLVLNASIMFPITSFLNYAWEDFEAKVMGEMKAAFYCVKAVVPGMLERKKGCIVGVSSGLSRHPGFGFCAHSTAKSGLDALMKSLAFELGPAGIRVNTVAPGLTITDATAGLPPQQKEMMASMTPLRRNALPEDVAGAILMLVREEAGFVTGNYVTVDGGMQML